jgi:hypothetical protein
MILTAHNFRRLLTIVGRHRDTYGPAQGLLLVVKNPRNASWQMRYECQGKERWLGLGSARMVDLREARKRASAARLQLLNGIDPIASRRANHSD